MVPNPFMTAHSPDDHAYACEKKKESDSVIIYTRPLRRISEDLDIRTNDLVNTPMQDLIAAFNTVEARIRLGKLGNAD